MIEAFVGWILICSASLFFALIALCVIVASTWPIWLIVIGLHFAIKWW